MRRVNETMGEHNWEILVKCKNCGEVRGFYNTKYCPNAPTIGFSKAVLKGIKKAMKPAEKEKRG